MSPSELRLMLAALPWPNYTAEELNEVDRVLLECRTTVRLVKNDLLRKQRAAMPTPVKTPEQLAEAEKFNFVYPPGQRFE